MVQFLHQVVVCRQRCAQARVYRVRFALVRVKHVTSIFLAGRSAGGVGEQKDTRRFIQSCEGDGGREALSLGRVVGGG